MSPKKKTKLARARKHRANKSNLLKQDARIHGVATLLQKLEREEAAE